MEARGSSTLATIIFSLLIARSRQNPFNLYPDYDEQNTQVTCTEIVYSSKPGICPTPIKNQRCTRCEDYCRKDTDCPSTMKCCNQTGCGNWCRTPFEDSKNRTTTTTQPPRHDSNQMQSSKGLAPRFHIY